MTAAAATAFGAAPAPSVPTSKTERYLIMDVLRGFALFGVMLINLTEMGGETILITTAQLAALPAAGLNDALMFWVNLLAYDKANTLFAFLFGLGFWVQMQRLEARGAAFQTIYLRRITILLMIGLVHVMFFFAWDILHVYGIAAFILFFCRKLPDRALFWLGASLLLFGKPLIGWAFEASGISGPYDTIWTAESAILARQAAAQSDSLLAFTSAMRGMLYFEWLLNGSLIAWIAYALGRFFMGAWIGSKGWIQNAQANQHLFRRWLWPLLIGGLLLESAHLLGGNLVAGTSLEPLLGVLHAIATPMIAAGYVCGLVVLFQSRSLSWLAKPFAPVGQMALTNYLLQSLAIIMILTGWGPGLGLAGKAGASTFLPFVIAFFAAQIVVSHLWLRVFAYGPLEWVWRVLTYGTRPRMRRQALRSPAGSEKTAT